MAKFKAAAPESDILVYLVLLLSTVTITLKL